MVNAEVAEVEVVEAVDVDGAEVNDVDMVEVLEDAGVNVLAEVSMEGEAGGIPFDRGLGRGRSIKRKTKLFNA